MSDGIFELYHSGLMTSHQGLTRTYYKIRQDFFIRNLYKYLHLYIISCRVYSARSNISFNQKQRSWSSQVIHDLGFMESISIDLKGCGKPSNIISLLQLPLDHAFATTPTLSLQTH